MDTLITGLNLILSCVGTERARYVVQAEHDVIYVNVPNQDLTADVVQQLRGLARWHYDADASAWVFYT